MAYLINSSAASLSPQTQEWEDIVLGYDHNSAPIYSGFKNIKLGFPECSVAHYQQWSQMVNGASLTTLTVPSQDSAASYVALSGVYLEFERRPQLQAGLVSEWSLRVRGAQP